MRLFILLALASIVTAQETDPPPTTPAAGDPKAAAETPEGEDCEEAWEYLEFLKSEIKEKIENILQKTLFEPKKLLEETVSDTMTKTLEIRDAVLGRTKSLRTGDGVIKTCPDQGVNQEQFLTVLRMEIMGVLLKLIEPNSAQPDKLQDIGKDLLAMRSKVNAEITRIIMLREAKGTVRTSDSACDCGILKDISDGLSEVINKTAGEEPSPVAMLTMILMTVDGRIGVLYNEILGQLEDDKRSKSTEELKSLKGISSELNDLIAKMAEVKADTEEGARKLGQIVERDVAKLRNDVERQLQQCRKNCPSDCESCGAKKIDELLQKFQDFNATLEDSDESDAKDSIRSELMQYLSAANNEMTELLTQKANEGKLEQCESEKLEVLEKFKGPLWMMVNVTIFGDLDTMRGMLVALNEAFDEMQGSYCSSTTPPTLRDNPDECDQQEIVNTQKWISDIDSIISTNIFKPKDETGKVNTMLGFIKLKSDLDDRVRTLFADGYKCGEEVQQIKNIYMGMVTDCLREMMNPNYEFKAVSRAERVQCIKQIRVTMEDRRGELLLREVERRISQEVLAEGEAGNGVENEGGQ